MKALLLLLLALALAACSREAPSLLYPSGTSVRVWINQPLTDPKQRPAVADPSENPGPAQEMKDE